MRDCRCLVLVTGQKDKELLFFQPRAGGLGTLSNAGRKMDAKLKKEETERELLLRLRKEFGKTWFTATMAKAKVRKSVV